MATRVVAVVAALVEEDVVGVAASAAEGGVVAVEVVVSMEAGAAVVVVGVALAASAEEEEEEDLVVAEDEVASVGAVVEGSALSAGSLIVGWLWARSLPSSDMMVSLERLAAGTREGQWLSGKSRQLTAHLRETYRHYLVHDPAVWQEVRLPQ